MKACARRVSDTPPVAVTVALLAFHARGMDGQDERKCIEKNVLALGRHSQGNLTLQSGNVLTQNVNSNYLITFLMLRRGSLSPWKFAGGSKCQSHIIISRFDVKTRSREISIKEKRYT